MSPLMGSSEGPLWKEMPFSRAFSTYPPGSPARGPSLQVPQQGPYGERYPFTGHFCKSLETLIKIPLNKKSLFSFL
jgi:hypothetical protein